MNKQFPLEKDSSFSFSIFTEPKQQIYLQMNHCYHPDKMILSNDYRFFATSCWALKKLQIWNIEDKSILKEIVLNPSDQQVSFIYFSKDCKSFYYAQSYSKQIAIVELLMKAFRTKYINFGEYLQNLSISPNEGYFSNILYGFENKCTIWTKCSNFVVKKQLIQLPLNDKWRTIFSKDEKQLVAATISKKLEGHSGNVVFQISSLENSNKIKSWKILSKGVVIYDFAITSQKILLICLLHEYYIGRVSIMNLNTLRIFRSVEFQENFKRIIDYKIIVQIQRQQEIGDVSNSTTVQIIDIITLKKKIVRAFISERESFFVLDNGIVVFHFLTQTQNHLKVIF